MKQQTDTVKTIAQVMPRTAVPISETGSQRSEEEKKMEAMIMIEKYGKLMNEPVSYPKWDYTQLKKRILENNPGFVLDNFNRQEFNLMCLYYSGDPRFEQDGRSFAKGLAMYGPVGCGKSSMLSLFMFNTFRPFGMVTCRGVADQYVKDGNESLIHYSSMQTVYPRQNLGFSKLGRCFDDLGKEDPKNNFGNQVDVMIDIIDRIYEKRLGGNFHLITNLNGDGISGRYGEWIKSRMRSLFNLIQFDKNSPDRRK